MTSLQMKERVNERLLQLSGTGRWDMHGTGRLQGIFTCPLCNASAMWPSRKERVWLLGRHRHTTVAKGMPACRDGGECWGLVVF